VADLAATRFAISPLAETFGQVIGLEDTSRALAAMNGPSAGPG